MVAIVGFACYSLVALMLSIAFGVWVYRILGRWL